ncbi:unnamed protein product [Arabis nemorensis]|uniref:Uncharacterized protein n=1 Tax=Arabis nemorensis TaxID=586526 RepID=A0A565ART6_9BRAS|nr:unnamed protein product [Arabis nemorensis]
MVVRRDLIETRGDVIGSCWRGAAACGCLPSEAATSLQQGLRVVGRSPPLMVRDVSK